jgi:two-component system, NarL family, sensor kinase
MLLQYKYSVLTLILVSCILIFCLILFFAFIIFRYQKRQHIYYKGLEDLKAKHQNDILQSQLEIQEQTFQNISQEIHDNIGQKLSLTKLNLNTINIDQRENAAVQIANAVSMIGEVINDLSDLSRSMSSEIILSNGFIKAMEFEVNQMNKPGMYSIRLKVTGEAIYMEARRELILFRIVQEALNNIIKHAEATEILIELFFTEESLSLLINDNGKGFVIEKLQSGNGFINMQKRAQSLNGLCEIFSQPGKGTSITIKIPLYEQEKV